MADKLVTNPTTTIAKLEADLRYYRQEHAKGYEKVVGLEREVVKLNNMLDGVIANRKKLAEFYHQRILEEFQEGFRG